ncbi:aspartate carbamoyltransferase catalytic subunit [Rhodococcoides kyotonense]|uniref:Aspartate carbamoyltransferase n=1 Tax=Rhodococcoides kyotonense TaxID=398843 RepID=A0A239CSY6_9NOCA|nr:aspartate carbamoyltransferase catalytic subunit [Rhodococcus kyotonensis]SNS22982.1 aspartate carbamoyltransferase catalytic subunit [Rhodococcus kyotonensis]
MKHLLSVADLTRESATELLDEADRFEQALLGREVKKLPTLRGRTVMTVFFENSTRTRVSFEVAGKWMSADVINVSASSSSVSKGESLRDTAMTLRAAGADALIVRHPASGAAHQIAAWTAGQGEGSSFGRSAGSTSGGPAVINAGDGTHEHPTQALLDALTLRQRLGGIEGKRIGIVGDILHSRVARSNAILLSTLGAEVVLIAPPTLLPIGASTWPVRVSHTIDAELPSLDAVLMLRVQAERMNGGFFPSPKEYSITYGLSQKRMDLLPEHAVVLHPGPMLRGMEIASSVADSPRTAVLQQVTNGVHVRMAVLFRLLVGSDGGES